MKDLSNATFIIPIRIESQDRLRNILTSVYFLLANFDTNIIVKEVDSKSIFKTDVLPLLEGADGIDLSKLTHIFEESNEPLFHRQKVLNEMIMEAKTKIVVNYDCDALLPLESYTTAYAAVLSGQCDVVYPYGQGVYQYMVDATDDLVNKFIDSEFDFEILKEQSKPENSDFGWVQFFDRDVYIKGGMENENFRAYAPEDKERHFRFNALGYKVGRINNLIYHLEHARGPNSWYNNPHMQHNLQLWEDLQRMDKKKLLEYYSKQEYLKKYQ